jgi:hypothetical protein
MLDVVVFVLHARSDEKTDFVESKTWVPRGSHARIHKVLGPAPTRQLLHHELLTRLGRGKLLVART